LNLRPLPCEGSALPLSYPPRVNVRIRFRCEFCQGVFVVSSNEESASGRHVGYSPFLVSFPCESQEGELRPEPRSGEGGILIVVMFQRMGGNRTHDRLRRVRAEPYLQPPLRYPLEHPPRHVCVSPGLQQPEAHVFHRAHPPRKPPLHRTPPREQLFQ
jgi:hypothetical protein